MNILYKDWLLHIRGNLLPIVGDIIQLSRIIPHENIVDENDLTRVLAYQNKNNCSYEQAFDWYFVNCTVIVGDDGSTKENN